jgi:hypothetical protein
LVLVVKPGCHFIPFFDGGRDGFQGEYLLEKAGVEAFHIVFDQGFVFLDLGLSCKDPELGSIFICGVLSLFELAEFGSSVSFEV